MTRFRLVLLVVALMLIAFGIYKVTQIIEDGAQIVISFASLATAAVVLLSVLEMKRARNESFKPYLLCNLNNVYAYNKRETDTSYLPLIWSSKELTEADVRIHAQSIPILYDPSRYSAMIVNIGKGAAKDIHAEWKFDLNDSISKLEHFAKENKFDFAVNSLASNNYEIHIDKACHSIYPVTRDMNFTFDYILAGAESNYALPILIPYAFIHLASIIIRIGIGSYAEINCLKDILPILKLTLSYWDIGGHKHVQQFCFRMHILRFTSSVLKEDIELFHGRFERVYL